MSARQASSSGEPCASTEDLEELNTLATLTDAGDRWPSARDRGRGVAALDVTADIARTTFRPRDRGCARHAGDAAAIRVAVRAGASRWVTGGGTCGSPYRLLRGSTTVLVASTVKAARVTAIEALRPPAARSGWRPSLSSSTSLVLFMSVFTSQAAVLVLSPILVEIAGDFDVFDGGGRSTESVRDTYRRTRSRTCLAFGRPGSIAIVAVYRRRIGGGRITRERGVALLCGARTSAGAALDPVPPSL